MLRDDLGLTGTKEGCSIGVCGACSVLVDGEILSGCLLPALFVDGRAVTTVEGLANGDTLSPLQEGMHSIPDQFAAIGGKILGCLLGLLQEILRKFNQDFPGFG